MTELPTSFGKYYLTEKLATGGMAEIYLAKIIGPGGFEKPVVIKQILPKLSGQRHFVDLFVAEAKTLVTLSHGNIVPVYELGVIDDTYFIAMDYIDGPTLYRLTETMSRREATMEPAVAAWITARMLEGLDYAHRKGEGVIHRDLSPRNVMLSRDGDVKLVDFGIAVTLGDPGEGSTRESAPTGSFPYMSPEQVRRESLNGQTDLFSAGVLLWEMLTGRRLFARPDADATLDAVLRADIPRPSSVRPEIPAKLDEVAMRALERDRDARWPAAADMLAALNKYLYTLDETPGPRDVAALVARFCPPETRRLPTHLEAIAQEAMAPEPFEGGRAPTETPVASGPSTAVIPRDQQARGKPQRQRSFATNVNLDAILSPGDPLPSFDEEADKPTKEDSPKTLRAETPSAFAADTDVDSRPPVERSPTTKPTERVTDDKPASTPPDERTADANPADANPADANPLAKLEVPKALREPPSRLALVIAGLGAAGLAIAVVVMFFQNRDHVLAMDERDAAVWRDAPAIDMHIDAAIDMPIDASTDIAPTIDAPVAVPAAIDAGVALARDAGTHHADAIVRAPIDAGAPTIDAAAKGTATLQVGADPWGEIYVDGKSMGRTPKELSVPAGHHTVEVVFPAETPPRKQTFSVDVANGDTKPIQADFK